MAHPQSTAVALRVLEKVITWADYLGSLPKPALILVALLPVCLAVLFAMSRERWGKYLIGYGIVIGFLVLYLIPVLNARDRRLEKRGGQERDHSKGCVEQVYETTPFQNTCWETQMELSQDAAELAHGDVMEMYGERLGAVMPIIFASCIITGLVISYCFCLSWVRNRSEADYQRFQLVYSPPPPPVSPTGSPLQQDEPVK